MNTFIIFVLLIAVSIAIGPPAIYFIYDFYKYKNSKFENESGNTYIKTRFNVGNYGEYLTFSKLERFPGKHKILTNVYIPKDNGQTTEIDLIFIHETGIYVIESKNYSGWIFGNEESKTWTQTFPNRRKERFFNPIWQNKTHIKYLLSLLQNKNIKVSEKWLQSLIVFSERCTLKEVTVASDNVKVIKRNDIVSVLNNIINNHNVIFTSNEVDEIYNVLKPFTCVSNDIKETHINNINNKAYTKKSLNKETTNDDKLMEDLKAYRLRISKQNNLKPYMVFNNAELDLVIKAMPMTVDDLKEIKGFGKVKCDRYGDEIIRIVKEYII